MGLIKQLFTNCACPQGRMGRAMLKFMNLCHAPLTNWGLVYLCRLRPPGYQPTHQVSSDWDDQIGKDQIPYPMGRLDSQPDYQEAPEAVIPFATAKNQNKTPQKAKIKHSKKQK